MPAVAIFKAYCNLHFYFQVQSAYRTPNLQPLLSAKECKQSAKTCHTGIGLALKLEEPEAASEKRPQLGGFSAEPGIAGKLVTWLQDLKLCLSLVLEFFVSALFL